MKRYLALLAMVPAVLGGTLAAVSPAHAAAPTPSASVALGVDAVIVADGVRLRSSPGGSYVIGLLYYGDYGQILGSSNGWCRFRLGGRSASGLPAGTTGWASCSYFATEEGRRMSEVAVDSLEAGSS
ncbi:SH3 domain-containing protein [Streptosporangium canum]|uniref:SH3 domain-containing protein n=1 Tax=Streptosporangium canum TaxID=324952 RepID=UPI0037B12F46